MQKIYRNTKPRKRVARENRGEDDDEREIEMRF